MSLFDLAARLSLDSSAYNRGIGTARSKLSTFAKVGAAAFGAVTVAATATTTALIKGVKETASFGDNVDKMSQKMGLTATAYQEWDAVMQHAGTSIESLQAGMKTLANAATSGNEAFAKLGISQEQIASMSQEDLFGATISGLQNVENETERTYLAGQLLGRGATELGALLNMSAEETDKLKQRVHELGGVMSDEAVKASATFDDNLQDLQTAFAGIKRQITADFLPGVNDVVAGFTSLIIGEAGAEEALTSGFEKIFVEIDNLVDNITGIVERIVPALISAIPKFVSVGTKLLSAIGKSIIKNVDTIVDAAFEIVNTLTTELFTGNNVTRLVNAAFEMIQHLANGLTENIPTILTAITEVTVALLEALTSPENIGGLVDAAIALLTSLADGLISSIGILIDRAPIILGNLVTAVVQNAPKLIEAAIALIHQLADGLIRFLPDLVAILPGLVMTIMQAIIDNAPALLSAGLSIINELLFGIVDNIPLILEQLPSMVQQIVDGLVENAPMLITSGIEAIVQLWEGIVRAIPDLVGHLPELVGAIGEGIKALASGLWDAGKSLVSGLWDGIKNAFSGGSNTEISDGLQPDMEKAEGTAHSASWNIRSAFETNLGSIGSSTTISNSLDTAGAKIEKFASKASKTTDDTFSGLGKSISTSLSSIPKSTSTTFDGVTSGAKTSAETVQNVWKPVPDFFNDIWHKITNTFAETPRYLGTIFANARNSIQSVWSAVPSWFNGIWHSIANAFKTYEAYSWGADMMDNFIRGVQSRMNTLRSAIQSVADTIERMIGFSEPEEGSLSNFHTFAPDMMELFAQGVKENEDVVRRQIAESFDFGDLIQGGFGEVTYSTTGTGTVQEQLLGLLSRYLPQLANMQVVMDTGAVVGELRDGMNQSLGEVGRFDKRGMATA